ncbi:hypothetical protein NLG42_19865 [Flavobacterium plurextorum]|uniref:MauE/DoxX family redox-associated membrane protein n=1 Tax=Flavobacterium TaxID=237 RepID=UPI00214D79FE|nr:MULTISPECIES: MauE/DoxX family redox-associated membrane protein [Flavobacterium]UUW08353.1 hypothetical protein NLG42_19865 [Flavobacterium plurextorum]
MKTSISFKNTIADIICLLYILLFVYAAVSKLLEFQNFRVQLGQSPLLSAFAGYIAWMLPILELFIVLLIVSKRWRIIGLFGALFMMAMFTAYIFIILNYSPFVPCSCGGILEKMGWEEHFIFNCVFMMLAAAGILILRRDVPKAHFISKPAALASAFSVTIFFSIGIVALLFMLSEDIIHYRNNFIRRFPHHLAKQLNSLDLQYNSYYLAGAENGKIYLGNVTTPLRLIAIDSSLIKKEIITITVDRNKNLLKSPQIRVVGNSFYLSEGSSSLIFSGNISNWHATLQVKDGTRFSLLEPVDSTFAGMRYFHPQTGENVLGTVRLDGARSRYLAESLLQKQIDGIFDTDGMLRYDRTTRSFIYVHLYKNEILVCDSEMKLRFRSKTIDTVGRASIRLTKTNKENIRTFASRPLVVNKTAAVFNGLLFVNSQLPGQYEDDLMWKASSIIDVYDLSNGAYRSSFYIDNVQRKKLDSFIIRNGCLYAMIGNHLVSYSLKKNLRAESKKI